MADPNELATKAIKVIRDAQGYLDTRRDGVLAPDQDWIDDWKTGLKERMEALSTVPAPSRIHVPLGDADDARLGEFLSQQIDLTSQQLDLTHKYIQALRTSDDLAHIDIALRALDHQLGILVGPHGPGAGRPGGWPPKRGTGNG